MNKEEFQKFLENFWKKHKKPFAFGIGQGIYDSKENLIAVRWLTTNVCNNFGTAAVFMNIIESEEDKLTGKDIIEKYFSSFEDDGNYHSNIEALKFIYDGTPIIKIYSDESELTDTIPVDICDIHFRLCLLSRRYYKPNSLNLDGMFNILPNLIWTTSYAYSLPDYERKWYNLQSNGFEYPLCQDKIPPMYWANPAPYGIRVANTTMVRNGAYLAEGTTVMHYGFVNHNAGSLGDSMIEGRISAGTTIDCGTDVGVLVLVS